MNRITKFVRLVQINFILMRYSINRKVIGQDFNLLRQFSYLNPFSWKTDTKTRGESIRITLESLGPIFVKFGQVLSTRQDLLPDDIIHELEKLQDRVPPFSSKKAKAILEHSLGKPAEEVFATFDKEPFASASIAQVHGAELHTGESVIVKIVRPNIKKIIDQDIALLYSLAELTERFWSQGYRLRPTELVAEFERTILDELDMMREAANASQLSRNFADSKLLYVPKIYWDHTGRDVLVMERIHGVPVSDLSTLTQQNVNLKKLSERGVEIFFTQVFRDSFFHADMHPGNIFVDTSNPDDPTYLGVDFGIMGTLNPVDQEYLAQNLLAFFKRDYRRVATLHIESGWVPTDTRVDQFESAIRTVCEPIFEKPLKDISFGQLLLRLFQTAERFNMEVQPQLMLLQKTLLNVESLGRQIYPDLDLWVTAKPFLQKFVSKQKGLLPLVKDIVSHIPGAAEKISKTPELFFEVLGNINNQQRHALSPIVQEQRRQKKQHHQKRGFIAGLGVSLTAFAILNLLTHREHWHWWHDWPGFAIAIGVSLLFLNWLLPRKH